MAGDDTSGSRQKGRPKLEEAAEIDLAIREATIKVLLEQGEAATLNSVAHAAGLSRKSVYARYSSKSDLFLAVIRGLLEGAHGVEFDASGSIEEKLLNYVRAALALTSAPEARAIQRLLNVNPAYIAALKPDMLAATQKHFFNPLRDLLKGAHRDAELAVEDVDGTTRVIVRLIFMESMTTDGDVQASSETGAQDAYARFITRLITRGLLPRAEI